MLHLCCHEPCTRLSCSPSFKCTNETSWFHRSATYIENLWHITEVELVLLLVELLELRRVVVLTLLRDVCPHVSLLFSLEPHARTAKLDSINLMTI